MTRAHHTECPECGREIVVWTGHQSHPWGSATAREAVFEVDRLCNCDVDLDELVEGVA